MLTGATLPLCAHCHRVLCLLQPSTGPITPVSHESVVRALCVHSRKIGRASAVSTGVRYIVVEWLGEVAALDVVVPDMDAVSELSSTHGAAGLIVYTRRPLHSTAIPSAFDGGQKIYREPEQQVLVALT